MTPAYTRALAALFLALPAHAEPGPTAPAYTYAAEVQRVVDGDTIDVTIDVGFRIHLANERIRILCVDAPETRTRDLAEKAAGIIAKSWLRERLSRADVVIVQTVEDDAFGRWLAHVYADGVSVAEEMLALGFAERRPC